MPIESVDNDRGALTLSVVADFPVSVQRLWDAYADPRQIERLWGPPMWPATFARHDFFPGGRSAYVMTGPEGEESRGYWEFLRVDAHRGFEVLDGFSHSDGSPNTELPTTRMVFDFDSTDSGSRLTTTSHFGSAEQLDQLLDMGMEEGLREAMAQIDDVVADSRTFAAEMPAEARILGDTTVRIGRVVRGTPEAIWAAHHDPDLVARWMTGPDGWSMPVCETATQVGANYRYVWRNDADGASFQSTGEVLEMAEPHRVVFTERMEGDMIPEGAPGTLNEVTFTALEGGTLVVVVVTYPDAQTRDAVLGTGMVEGMEQSYARLETDVLDS